MTSFVPERAAIGRWRRKAKGRMARKSAAVTGEPAGAAYSSIELVECGCPKVRLPPDADTVADFSATAAEWPEWTLLGHSALTLGMALFAPNRSPHSTA